MNRRAGDFSSDRQLVWLSLCALPIAARRPLGMITRADLLDADDLDSDAIIAFDLVARPPVVVQPWESCRTAAERMAEAGVGRLSVVADDGSGELVGIVTPTDLLVARRRRLEEEREREPPMFLRKG